MILLCIGILVVLSFSRVPGGFRLFTVLSGSMEPVLHTGSVIFVKSAENYNIGDIVTRTTSDPKVTITHRIISATETDGQKIFEAKGDANNSQDNEKFSKSDIIGREFFTIPYLGFLISFAKTQQGLLFLVIIPAIIIIYEELGKIVKEIKKLRLKKFNRDESLYKFYDKD